MTNTQKNGNVSVQSTAHNRGFSQKTYYHVRIYTLSATITHYAFENRLSILKFLRNWYDDLYQFDLDNDLDNDLRVAFDVDFFRGVPHLTLPKSYFSHLQKLGIISRCQILDSFGNATETYYVSCTKSVKRCK